MSWWAEVWGILQPDKSEKGGWGTFSHTELFKEKAA